MGGSGDDAGGYGNEQLGALEVVGDSKGLLGEGAPADGAAVSGYAAAVGAGERAEQLVGEAAGCGEMVLGAIGAGAERGGEASLNLDRLNPPPHAGP